MVSALPVTIIIDQFNFLSSLVGPRYKKAPDSFLFTLSTQAVLPLIAGHEADAIWCDSRFGPVFGSGCDLVISNAPNFNNCSVYLNNTYQCPAGQNADTFLTGNTDFLVSEMEVFGFEK